MIDTERSEGAEQTGAKERYRLPLFCAVNTLFWFSLYTYVSFFTDYVESKAPLMSWQERFSRPTASLRLSCASRSVSYRIGFGPESPL